jgi:hypothetical protein
MSAHVVLDHFRHESGHRAARARDSVHDPIATGLRLERALDPFDLSFDAAHTRQKLLLVPNGVRHVSS